MKTEFILTAEGVNKSFDGFKAINDLNFYLDKGELRTVIGPNGAGKSTFLDLITGRTRPDTGIIEYRGTPVTKLREYRSTAWESAGSFKHRVSIPTILCSKTFCLVWKAAAACGLQFSDE